MGFESLTGRFSAIVRNLQGRGRLTPENIADSLRDVRVALLEADVGLDVVKEFIDKLSVNSFTTSKPTSASSSATGRCWLGCGERVYRQLEVLQ